MSELPEGYELTDDPARLDAAAAHSFLTHSYWAQGISFETVERAIQGSLCIAVLKDGKQVGFARAITDRATFAYLADVYVLDVHRGKGLASAMLARLEGHPELQGLRRWALFTQDAQPLYARSGWTQYPHPERFMVRDFPDRYQ